MVSSTSKFPYPLAPITTKKNQMKKKQICILGSTGSIGTQALEVIAEHPDRYEAYCLTANTQVEKLASRHAVSARPLLS